MNPEDVRSESVDPDILVITWEVSPIYFQKYFNYYLNKNIADPYNSQGLTIFIFYTNKIFPLEYTVDSLYPWVPLLWIKSTTYSKRKNPETSVCIINSLCFIYFMYVAYYASV